MTNEKMVELLRRIAMGRADAVEELAQHLCPAQAPEKAAAVDPGPVREVVEIPVFTFPEIDMGTAKPVAKPRRAAK